MAADAFTVAYARVSTPGQNPENQLAEIEAAGHRPDAAYVDVVSRLISRRPLRLLRAKAAHDWRAVLPA